MNELTIELTGGDRRPLYEQIYDFIRKDIQSGRLSCGTKLPSTRALANYLEVSRNTVEMAYSQLISEGYIEAVPCSGCFVCKIEGLYLPSSGISVNHEAEESTDIGYRYDFTPNGADSNSFPLASWRKLTKEVMSGEGDVFYRPAVPQGERGLRESICSYLYQSRGVKASAEQVVIGAGNDYLLMLLSCLLRSVTGRKLRIAMETPTYMRAYHTLKMAGNDITTVGMDHSGMVTDELARTNADIAYIMPSHQYPIGTVMPITRRIELLKWACEEQGRYLIEDDYDSEFRYRGKPIPALQGSDKDGKVIYISTFSRAIAPSIRISYMVLPAALLDKCRHEISQFGSTVSEIDQLVLQEFMDKGYFERHLNKMRALYKGKHDRLLNDLRPYRDRIRISGDGAGVHILLHLGDYLSEQEAVKLAAAAGIRVYGLSGCCVGGRQPSGQETVVIMGYATIPSAEIDDAVRKLAAAWKL